MKTNKKTYLLICCIIIILIVSYFIKLKKQQTKNIIIEKSTPEIKNLEDYIEEIGFITPKNEIKIVSKFNGRIDNFFVKEGDKIKKGQPLASIISDEAEIISDILLNSKNNNIKKNIINPIKIISPIDGIVISLNNIYQSVNEKPPNNEVLTIADELIATVDIDEIDVKYLKIGNNVLIFPEAYQNEKIKGIIEYIPYTCINKHGINVYPIKIKLENKSKIINPGMTVIVKILIKHKKNALSIRNNFINENSGIKTVNILSKNGSKFDEKRIKTGITNGVYTEILSGLNKNDVIVIPKKINE
ncbi:MAG: HlyD family efflux transporter periplasmic adaptor subunit [Endomicrobium sp.]|jgi:multidrug efflux pump subunit AcrA (membrane-fusion protein)|nr:HlyD family efflux transporter periplasmic adaptor subunit [Endomicrobium sp.]